jgi:arginine utilization protein RocB
MLNKDRENLLRALIFELVLVNSVVNSDGERVMADKIMTILSDFAVFKENPDWLRICPVIDDPLHRYSVLALIKRPGITDTVLGIGHFDTVAIEDYGSLKPYANNPEELALRMKSVIVDPEVIADLDDPDYLFSRGSLDMKSGIAIWLTLLDALSQADTNKNLLVCFVCDEEGNSKGMIDAIGHIKQMVKDHSWTQSAFRNRYRLYISSIYR